MAITTSLCNNAKLAFLRGEILAAHVFKIALIKAGHTGTFNASTGNYSTGLAGDECATAGNYVQGGNTLTGYSAVLTSSTASIDWSDSTWTTASISADGAVIYDDTHASKIILAVYSFADVGSIPVTSTSADFVVTIPNAGVGVIRFA